MKTVVGCVSDYREAEAMVRELTRLGFKYEDIEIIGMETGGAQIEGGKEVFFRSIEEFFGSEEAPEVRGYYEKRVQPGGMIVSVFAEDEEADRAARAMIRHGAVRIYSHCTEKTIVEELTLRKEEDISGKNGDMRNMM
jgi:hypothetical protein